MSAATSDREVFFEARCRAFTGEGVRTHRICVSSGRVWVYEAHGIYTTCHALSQSAQRRLIARAKDIQAQGE